MSIGVVFLLVFLSLLGITLGIPSLPPADLLKNLLGIPEISYNFFIFSGELILNGIINGIVWGAFITVIYGLGRRNSKSVIVLPVATPSPPPTPSPTPRPIKMPIVKQPVSEPKLEYSKIRTFVNLNKDVQTIEGIGPKYGSRLKVCGVKDLEELLDVGSTLKGRRYLAEEVGVSVQKLFEWVNKADFSRLKGVGKQYAELLDVAGVKTVKDLSWRDSKNLYDKLRLTNIEKNLVRRTPPYYMIRDWIQNAKRLEQIVEC